jgi:hypothetical protein
VFVGECVSFTRRRINNGHEITTYKLPLISVELIPSSINQSSQRTLSSGKHTWPFRFSLPMHLPPSTTQLEPYDQYIKYHMWVNCAGIVPFDVKNRKK